MVSIHQLAKQVSGIVNAPVTIKERDDRRFTMGPDKDKEGAYIMGIPKGIRLVDDSVRASFLHEAFHGRYTSIWVSEYQIGKLAEEMGLEDVSPKAVKFAANIIEDIHIEARGGREFLGAGYMMHASNRKAARGMVDKLFGKDDKLFAYHYYHTDKAQYNEDYSDIEPYTDEEARDLQARTAGLILFMICTGSAGVDPILCEGGYWGDAVDGHLTRLANSDLHKTAAKRSGLVHRNLVLNTLIDNAGVTLFEFRDYNKRLAAETKFRRYQEGLATMFSLCESSQEAWALGARVIAPFLLTENEIKVLKEIAKRHLDDTMPENNKEQECEGGEGQGELKEGSGAASVGSGFKILDEFEAQELLENLQEIEQRPLQYGPIGGMKMKDQKQKINANDPLGRIKAINTVASDLKQALKPLLERIKAERDNESFVSGVKKGQRIDSHLIHRVLTDEEEIFMRKIEPELEDSVAFSMVVDVSGSMFSGNTPETDRYTTAAGIGFGMNMALTEIERSCSLIPFHNNAEVIVSAHERANVSHVQRFVELGSGGTAIIKGYDVAEQELLKEHDKNMKVCFLLTDGGVSGNDIVSIRERAGKAGIYLVYICLNDAYGANVITTNMEGDTNHQLYDIRENPSALTPKLDQFIRDVIEKRITLKKKGR